MGQTTFADDRPTKDFTPIPRSKEVALEAVVPFLVGAAVAGIIGNRADDVFRRVMQTVLERLRRGGRPVNHDLQKATRKAYLQATLALIDARLGELGIDPYQRYGDLRRLQSNKQEAQLLIAVRNALQRELKQLPNAAYIPPPSEAEQQVELLLQPRGETAQQRTGELKALLKAHLLQELRERWRVQPSERLQEMLQSGWQETPKRGKAFTLDWFDLMCAFFVEELKQNPRVADIFQSQLLANLSVESVSVDYTAFVQQLEQFGGRRCSGCSRLSRRSRSCVRSRRKAFGRLSNALTSTCPHC